MPDLFDSLDAPDGDGVENNENISAGAGPSDASTAHAGAETAAVGSGEDGAAAAGAGAGDGQSDADAAGASAAAATDAKQAAGGAAPGTEQRPAVVPQAALAEERERVRQLRARIAELEAQPKLTAEDRAALDELRAARAAKAEQPPPAPDFIEDPKGYVDTKIGDAIKKLENVEQMTQQQKQAAEQQAQLQAFARTVAASEAEFIKSAPDYHDALKFMRDARTEQLRIMAPDATDEQIHRQILIEEAQLSAQAIKQGRDPANVAYTLAQRFGYRKPETPQPAAAAEQPGAAKAADRDALRTLGAGGLPDQATESDTDGSNMPEFAEAFGERFGRRR